MKWTDDIGNAPDHEGTNSAIELGPRLQLLLGYSRSLSDILSLSSAVQVAMDIHVCRDSTLTEQVYQVGSYLSRDV